MTGASAAPNSIAEAAEILGNSTSVRFAGGKTKIGWGTVVGPADTTLSTSGISEIVEHNAGDLTAVLEAGVPLSTAQRKFADSGQMLAIDPPDPGGATIGGIAATADSGPLRHRYGAFRDLIVGATLVLADGTVARSGGKVIKNVAGYDLAKLFCGSFGTLGLIARVAVRLHPLAPKTLTLVARATRIGPIRDAALALAKLPVEFDCLDVRYAGGHGEVLGRLGGSDPGGRLKAAIRELEKLPVEIETVHDDAETWSAQRTAQRSTDGSVLKISGLPSRVDELMQAAKTAGSSLVGRAAMGVYWITVDGDEADQVAAIEDLRERLSDFSCMVADAPEAVRRKVDVWDPSDDWPVSIMKRVKARFDPTSKCNPGLFVGGI